MPTEKDLQAYFIKMCRQTGWLAYKVNIDGARGWPDVIVIAPDCVAFVEVKHPNGRGRLSPHQKHMMRELRKRGAKVHVIQSRDEADETVLQMRHDKAGQ